MKKPLIAIVGPTATGKTEVGVELALRLNGEIVSADSMLVYKGMDIGTAKPTIEERRGVPHHLIDMIMPYEEFNVAIYQRETEKVIEEIYNRNKLPIIVGGTGLYVRSVIDDYNFNTPSRDKQLRQYLKEMELKRGKIWLHQQLEEIDPAAAKKIHPNNVRRVVRALEICKLTGKRFSDLQQANYQNTKYDAAIFGLIYPREVLYQRINLRVDKMIATGLVEEVKSLIQTGIKRSNTAMQGLGYKEIAAYLDGESSLEEAVELLKRGTRRLAKRQMTWFRRDPRINWLDRHDIDMSQVIKEIINFWQEKHFAMSN